MVKVVVKNEWVSLLACFKVIESFGILRFKVSLCGSSRYLIIYDSCVQSLHACCFKERACAFTGSLGFWWDGECAYGREVNLRHLFKSELMMSP